MIMGVNLKFLLSILNSSVFNCISLQNANQTGGKGVDFLQTLFIPKILKEKQEPFKELVDKILEAKKANPDAYTSAQEAKIDKMVYELYGLTEEEIKIVEGESK